MKKFVYKGDRRKGILLVICAVIAFGVCIGVIGMLVSHLRLSTEYRQICFAINEKVIAASTQENKTMRYRDQSCRMSNDALNFYNQFLLDRDVLIASRKQIEPDENSIVLEFAGCRLSLTAFGESNEDGTDIAICWETPEETKYYTVLSGSITFVRLVSNFRIHYQKAIKAGEAGQ